MIWNMVSELQSAFQEHILIWSLFMSFVGAVMASFGGLVVYRLPHQLGWRDEPVENLTIVSPESMCESCHRKLSFVDLIPVVGWVVSKGRCVKCGDKIPVQYPVIELAMAFASGVSAFYFGPTLEGLTFLSLLWSGMIISWIDWNEAWIPSVITTPFMWFGLLYSPFAYFIEDRVWGAFVGFSVVTVSFWMIGKIKKIDAYSGGDIAFATMAGAFLGIGNIIPFLFLSSIFFIAYAAPLRRTGREWVPMGPALVLSLLASIILNSMGFNLGF